MRRSTKPGSTTHKSRVSTSPSESSEAECRCPQAELKVLSRNAANTWAILYCDRCHILGTVPDDRRLTTNPFTFNGALTGKKYAR